ncbi:MAG TPA: DNA methyltransferase [Terriglobales bacterium]|nr:DNA methyltransferase [Terriglobales bacterium]
MVSPDIDSAVQITRLLTSQRDPNRLLEADRVAHDWYRFVLSFPPHLVRHYAEAFYRGDGTVLDPFCGTGTTVVEAKKLGIPSVGIEANPMAAFAAGVKVTWDIDQNAMWHQACGIAEAASDILSSQGIQDQAGALFTAPATSQLRRLPPESEKLLLTNSISPLPLHKALVLLECLEKAGPAPFDGHLRLALASTLVQDASNLHFGPEVGVRGMKSDAPVIGPWLARVRQIQSDLATLSRDSATRARVLHADSRNATALVPAASVEAVITSPPYPNEKDYTRTTRLESVMLGFLRDKQQLRQMKQGLLRSNTRGVFRKDTDDEVVSDNATVADLATEIERRRKELGKTSGFERLYARLTKLYFGGMQRHLAGLRQILKPGAHLAYVVGDQASYFRVLIRTGQILAEISRSLGYEVLGIDLFRTRISTTTREQMREEVLLLRWPGA